MCTMASVTACAQLVLTSNRCGEKILARKSKEIIVSEQENEGGVSARLCRLR